MHWPELFVAIFVLTPLSEQREGGAGITVLPGCSAAPKPHAFCARGICGPSMIVVVVSPAG
eukprot:13461300-Heterocapsa_arctica.AAC.1